MAKDFQDCSNKYKQALLKIIPIFYEGPDSMPLFDFDLKTTRKQYETWEKSGPSIQKELREAITGLDAIAKQASIPPFRYKFDLPKYSVGIPPFRGKFDLSEHADKANPLNKGSINEITDNIICFFLSNLASLRIKGANQEFVESHIHDEANKQKEEYFEKYKGKLPEITAKKQDNQDKTLIYYKTRGVFRFGDSESIPISKISTHKVRKLAETLMKYWGTGKPCPQSKIVRDATKKTRRSVYDNTTKIRKSLERHLKVNMPQCSNNEYMPPSEPKRFEVVYKTN